MDRAPLPTCICMWVYKNAMLALQATSQHAVYTHAWKCDTLRNVSRRQLCQVWCACDREVTVPLTCTHHRQELLLTAVQLSGEEHRLAGLQTKFISFALSHFQSHSPVVQGGELTHWEKVPKGFIPQLSACNLSNVTWGTRGNTDSAPGDAHFSILYHLHMLNLYNSFILCKPVNQANSVLLPNWGYRVNKRKLHNQQMIWVEKYKATTVHFTTQWTETCATHIHDI